MKIRSIDRSINEILKSGFYRIPRFQRPYSWERENIEEFWTDVFVNSGADYFIGSMVAYKPDHSEISSVVDGQQRLTTIIMLLAAVRNSFKSEGFPELAAGVQALIERKDLANNSQYSLQTETSYPYFQEYIQSHEAPQITPKVRDEEEALRLTFNYLTAAIETTVAGLKGDKTAPQKTINERIRLKLTEMRDKILQLKVIFIDLDNEDDAYLIFETMNTRGKDLSQADLIKAHLTKLLRPTNANVDLAKQKWQSIVDVIEGSAADLDVTTYLHHFWLSRYEYVTVKGLYKSLRKKVNKTNAKQFLDALVQDATVYRQIQDTAYRAWKKDELPLRESLNALNLFRVKQPLPMILAVMHAYDTGELKMGQVRDALGAIERFHFFFTAITSQRSSGGISFMYAYHARGLLGAKDANERGKELSDLKAKLRQKIPTMEEFQPNFVELTYTKTQAKQKKLIHYVLAKIDRALDSGVALDYDQMTIEHLAPQSQSIKAKHVGNIGNLLLCEKGFNTHILANKSFAEKKTALLRSKVTVDDDIKSAQEWNAAQVTSRAEHMAEFSYKNVWKI